MLYSESAIYSFKVVASDNCSKIKREVDSAAYLKRNIIDILPGVNAREF
jgi:hypothetical protein